MSKSSKKAIYTNKLGINIQECYSSMTHSYPLIFLPSNYSWKNVLFDI